MALDVGTKRIGVALSDYLQVIAIPSVCIPREPEKKAIEEYLANRTPSRKKDEEFDSGIYQKIQTNIITYETTDFKETQKVEYIATKQETKKVKNQILCNK